MSDALEIEKLRIAEAEIKAVRDVQILFLKLGWIPFVAIAAISSIVLVILIAEDGTVHPSIFVVLTIVIVVALLCPIVLGGVVFNSAVKAAVRIGEIRVKIATLTDQFKGASAVDGSG